MFSHLLISFSSRFVLLFHSPFLYLGPYGDFTGDLKAIRGKGESQNGVMTRKIGVHVKNDTGQYD